MTNLLPVYPLFDAYTCEEDRNRVAPGPHPPESEGEAK